MTKYTIIGSKLYKNVKERMDFAPEMKFMNTMLTDGARKVFNNPVTALAYDYDDPAELDSEFQMDKKDIIKALDFWINDKVLENEKLLKLHNRLEDFHEEELKTLIWLKNRVLKLPSDTKFKRFIDNSTEQLRSHDSFSSDNVEFYYELKHPPKPHNPPLISSTENRHLNTTMNGHHYVLHGNAVDTTMTEEEIRELEWRLNRTLPRPTPRSEEWRQPVTSRTDDFMND